MDESNPVEPDGPETTEPDFADTPAEASNPEDGTINWTASEFIAHNKSPVWYIALIFGSVLVAGLAFFLTRDPIPSAVIIILGIALASYGARQPRQLKYALSQSGLLIADRYFPFDSFRSFAVVDEGAFGSIVFMPLKRFGQLITIYFDANDEEKIVDLLANQLPMEDKGGDALDQLMRRLRF